MHYTYTVTWKGNPVGEITELAQDMWNINGKWAPLGAPESKDFEHELLNFDRAAFAKDPAAAAIKVILFEYQHTDKPIYCLAMSIKDDKIYLRQVVVEEALDMFFPER